jgi:hypothetical protein
MGGACGIYGGNTRCIQGFDGKPDSKIPFGQNLGIYNKILSKWIFKILDGMARTRLIPFRIQKSGMLL